MEVTLSVSVYVFQVKKINNNNKKKYFDAEQHIVL